MAFHKKYPLNNLNFCAEEIVNHQISRQLFQNQNHKGKTKMQMKPLVPKQVSLMMTRHQFTERLIEEENEETICCSPKGKSLVERFCLDSSLHGLKYLGQPRRSIGEK